MSLETYKHKLSEESIKWLEEYRKKTPFNEKKFKASNKTFKKLKRDRQLGYLKLRLYGD
jgi:hypothetical protein